MCYSFAGPIFMGAFLIYPIISMVIDSFFEIGITGGKTFVDWKIISVPLRQAEFLKQLEKIHLYILLIAVSVETVIGPFVCVVL